MRVFDGCYDLVRDESRDYYVEFNILTKYSRLRIMTKHRIGKK